MIEGIDLDDAISAESGVDLRKLCGDAIDQSVNEGLVVQDRQHLRLTPRGVLFADTVASRLLG